VKNTHHIIVNAQQYTVCRYALLDSSLNLPVSISQLPHCSWRGLVLAVQWVTSQWLWLSLFM